MQNHIKTHNKHAHTFDCCQWETRSYALSLEHKKYAHLPEKLFPCKVCTKKFQMPTQLCCHENKVHMAYRSASLRPMSKVSVTLKFILSYTSCTVTSNKLFSCIHH